MTHVTGLTRTVVGVLAGLAVVAPLSGQGRRDSLVASAYNEFDTQQRLRSLYSAMDPALGSPDASWSNGVQLLAQTLIESGQDSLAAVWLRWAIRQAPALQVDTLQFLPKLVAAYRAARDFVAGTRTPGDSVVASMWLWPPERYGLEDRVGQLQVKPAALAAPIRFAVEGFGPVGGGATIELAPGSYQIRAMASGYDSARVTREVLPGATAVVDFQLRPVIARVIPEPVQAGAPVPSPPATAATQKKKGFPWLWVALGAGGAGVALAVLAGGGGSPQPTTGSITFTFPNP